MSPALDDDGALPGDEFDAGRTCVQVLEAAGFTFDHEDGKGTYWRRPGKTTPGHSAAVWNDNGTATLYSSSIDAPDEYIGPDRNLRPWQLHTALNHDGDYGAAARAWRVEHPRERRTVDGPALRLLAGGGGGNAGDEPEAAADEPEPTPSSVPVLPEDFWQARPAFEHIRQAARSRAIAPDSVLGAVLARACVLTDWRLVLPAIVGRVGSLNLCIGLAGESGAGKGSSMDAAEELLPDPSSALAALVGGGDHRVKTAPAGSGEGMVLAMFEEVEHLDDDGHGKAKKSTAFEQVYRGLLVRVDEGQLFAQLGARSGQTTLETIRSAWSGEAIGGAYVRNKAKLDAHEYRLALVMAVQPTLAAPIIEETAGGTAQRFVWLATDDPDAIDPDGPVGTPAWPGALSWRPAAWGSAVPVMVRNERRGEMPVADEVRAEIRRNKYLKLKGQRADAHEAHADLSRLKLAAVLAVLDGRINVNVEDWALAGLVQETSRGVRRYLEAAIRADADAKVRAADERAVVRQIAIDNAGDSVARVARNVHRHVHRHTSGELAAEGKRADVPSACTATCIRESLTSRDKKQKETLLAALDRATALGWLEVADEGEVALWPFTAKLDSLFQGQPGPFFTRAAGPRPFSGRE